MVRGVQVARTCADVRQPMAVELVFGSPGPWFLQPRRGWRAGAAGGARWTTGWRSRPSSSSLSSPAVATGLGGSWLGARGSGLETNVG